MCTAGLVRATILAPDEMPWTKGPPTFQGASQSPSSRAIRGRRGVHDAAHVPGRHPRGAAFPRRRQACDGPFGRCLVGYGGDVCRQNLRRMPVRSFILIPAGLPHYGIVEEETVIQAHGMGPWQTTYVNPGPTN